MQKNPHRHRSPQAIRIGLRNFRAFQDSGMFSLAPLTCLVGANSSGKSSIISALLLLKQSLEQEYVSSRVSPLALNGALCELGNYSDIVFRHKTKSHIGIDFQIPLAEFVEYQEHKSPIVSLAIPRSSLSRPIQRYYTYDLEGISGMPKAGCVELKLSFATDEPFGPSLSELAFSLPEIGGVRFVRTTKGRRTQHWRTYTDDIPSRSLELRFLRSGFFPRVVIRDEEFLKASPRDKKKVTMVQTVCRTAFGFLDQLLADSYSIGPFRTSPERRYSFGGFSSARGGKSGERTVDLLITEKLLKTANSPLQRRVSFWLKHLHLAEKISIEDIAKNHNLFSLSVAWSGQRGNSSIPDVGYGISQILPIIVQGLLMRPGGIFMIQQPELHLHPDAQAGLADFFLYLTNKGIRVIVETHSEYFLVRLRLRLAEKRVKLGSAYYGSGNDNFKIDRRNVSVLLTTMSKRSGSHVTELRIGDTFQFENLPVGFMDQALDDRLALLNVLN